MVDTIKRLCDERDITIKALERAVGFGNGTIRRWDTTSPALDKVRKIAEYFDVSVDYLLEEETEKVSAQESDRQIAVDIIDRINALLAEQGKTGAEMSRDLGLSNSIYSQWNTKKTKPSNKTLAKIADYFGVSVDYIKTGAEASGSELMENRIRELRKKRKMTMKQLGELLGLAESTISQYETGKREPDNETLLKLGEFFGVSVDYLLGAEPGNAPTPRSESEVTFDDFTYAMYEESKDLPPEKKQMLLEMARFMKADLKKDKM